ncbi:DUF1398 domain-containing protein [Flagellimonas baculiformis]|uniref:DUF1398 domain-containing protein n=1 Tax=Flagellimonas baculiformis TaxID=3067310 RepID=UPI00296E71C7|nr:DUF1398 family protein [Muricauda sp. D6]
MFTIEQIKAAHGKVKSGADFPAYIQEIKTLGVTQYETYVADGHVDYHGTNGHTIKAPAKYETIAIADACNREQFLIELKEHQKGNTDYPTFIAMSAEMGIEKWAISMKKMTCTYYDKKGKEILVEEIPQ